MFHKPTSRLDRFRKAARELECDEDEGRFEAALKKIASHKPEKKIEPKKD